MEYEDAMNEDQLLRKLIHQLAQIGPKMVGRSIKKLDLARSVGHTLICYTIIIAFEVHIFSHLIPNTILPTFFKKIFSLNLNWTVTVCRKFGWNRTENASQCNLIEPSLTPREPRTFFKCHHGGRTGLGSTLNGRYVSQSTTVRPSVCPSVRPSAVGPLALTRSAATPYDKNADSVFGSQIWLTAISQHP